MKKIVVTVFLVLTTASCSGTSNSGVNGVNSGKLPGPQNPGVMVDDDNHCTMTRSAMLDKPEQTFWSTGCK